MVPKQASGATDGLVFRSAGIPTYGVDATFMRDKDDFAHGLNERAAGGGVLRRPEMLVPAGQGPRGHGADSGS